MNIDSVLYRNGSKRNNYFLVVAGKKKIISEFSLISNINAAYGSAMSIHLSGHPTTAFELNSQL